MFTMTIRQRIALERTYGLGERLTRLRDRLARGAAYHLIPKRVREWVVIRAWADATTGEYGSVEAPACLVTDALKRMK